MQNWSHPSLKYLAAFTKAAVCAWRVHCGKVLNCRFISAVVLPALLFLLGGALILYVFPGSDPFPLSFPIDRGELFGAAAEPRRAR